MVTVPVSSVCAYPGSKGCAVSCLAGRQRSPTTKSGRKRHAPVRLPHVEYSHLLLAPSAIGAYGGVTSLAAMFRTSGFGLVQNPRSGTRVAKRNAAGYTTKFEPAIRRVLGVGEGPQQ